MHTDKMLMLFKKNQMISDLYRIPCDSLSFLLQSHTIDCVNRCLFYQLLNILTDLEILKM